MTTRGELPVWVDIGVIPLLNLVIALLVAGLVVVIIGENPFQALGILLDGALGSLKGWSYMTYYATDFIFTGLAVAIAFHAGLFNIGGEGQAYVAGLGAATAGLTLEFLPWWLVIPIAILGLGGLWRSVGLGAGLSPGQAWQPHRHHHHHVQLHCVELALLSHQSRLPALGQNGG
jgi:general nucleoside transport system permease protein